MHKDNNLKIFDLVSLVMLGLILLLSLSRFTLGPQFIDGYYHLATANAFINSGGWVGIDYWSIAPLERPHLYPPLYHILIAFIKSLGADGISAIKITEVSIPPLFFLLLWHRLRAQFSPVFSHYFLLTSASFFAFYVSVSANIPASLALIFGVYSQYFITRKKYTSAILLFALSFYTHAGISFIFLIAFLFCACLDKKLRADYLKVITYSLLLSSLMLYHYAKNISHLTLSVVNQSKFSHFSPFIITIGITSAIYCLRKKKTDCLFFFGYLIGSCIIFFKYPYRLFSAQGALGLIWLAAYFLMNLHNKISPRKGLILFLTTSFFLFFAHSTLDLKEGKLKFNPLNSTYHNVASGATEESIEFSSLYSASIYDPLVATIKNKTKTLDIISSNSELSTQIISSLSNRPGAQTIFKETNRRHINPATSGNIILWLKGENNTGLLPTQQNPNLEKIYEDKLFSL